MYEQNQQPKPRRRSYTSKSTHAKFDENQRGLFGDPRYENYDFVLGQTFDYNDVAGELIDRRTGKPANTTKDKAGYLRIKHLDRTHLVHHVVFFLKAHRWPKQGLVIDHRNGDRQDNRWHNLAEATPMENAQNRPKPNGINAGIYKIQSLGKWGARIAANGQHYNLGDNFESEQAARDAYNQAQKTLHKKFAYNNRPK